MLGGGEAKGNNLAGIANPVHNMLVYEEKVSKEMKHFSKNRST